MRARWLLTAWFALATLLSIFSIAAQRLWSRYPAHIDEWAHLYLVRVEGSTGLSIHQKGFHSIISFFDSFTQVHEIWIWLIFAQLVLFGIATALILSSRNRPSWTLPLPMLLAALVPTSIKTFGFAIFVPFTLSIAIGLFAWIRVPERYSLARILPIVGAALMHPVGAGVCALGLIGTWWFEGSQRDRIAAITLIVIGAVAYLLVTPSILVGPSFEGIDQSARPLLAITIVALASLTLTRPRWALPLTAFLGATYVLGTLGLPTIGLHYWRAVGALSMLAPLVALIAARTPHVLATVLLAALLLSLPTEPLLRPLDIERIDSIRALPDLSNASLVSAPVRDALEIGAIHSVRVVASRYFIGTDRDRIERERIEQGSCINRADRSLPERTRFADAMITKDPYACPGWIETHADPYVSIFDIRDPPWWDRSWPHRQRIFHSYAGTYSTAIDGYGFVPDVRILALEANGSYEMIPSTLEEGVAGPVVSYTLTPEHDTIFAYVRPGGRPQPLASIEELTWIDEDRSSDSRSDTDGSSVTIRAAGADVWLDTNEYAGLFTRLSGLFEASTTIIEQDETDEWTKSGIMLRDRGNGSRQYALVAITPEHGVIFEFDSDGDGNLDTHTNVPGVSLPVELTLRRSINGVEARYRSGTDEGLIGGRYDRTTRASAEVGLFHMSHDPDVSGTGSFVGFSNLRMNDDSRTGPIESLTPPAQS